MAARPKERVVRKQAEPTQIKGHKVAASKDEPQFIVQTDDRKRGAHKASTLIKK